VYDVAQRAEADQQDPHQESAILASRSRVE
jgi:hypothetical protein